MDEDAELEGLLEEAKTPLHPVGARPPVKLNYSHDAMIDLLIANPGISQNEVARRFGYSASWVSTIMSTDAFQSRFAERKDEIVDPAIRATVEEHFKGAVARSLEIIRHKLSKPADQVGDNLVLRTLEISSRALGYGARKDPPPVPSLHLHLDVLGDNLTTLLRRKKAEAIDGELIHEEPPPAKAG